MGIGVLAASFLALGLGGRKGCRLDMNGRVGDLKKSELKGPTGGEPKTWPGMDST